MSVLKTTRFAILLKAHKYNYFACLRHVIILLAGFEDHHCYYWFLLRLAHVYEHEHVHWAPLRWRKSMGWDCFQRVAIQRTVSLHCTNTHRMNEWMNELMRQIYFWRLLAVICKLLAAWGLKWMSALDSAGNLTGCCSAWAIQTQTKTQHEE